jgi:hypothetical protein
MSHPFVVSAPISTGGVRVTSGRCACESLHCHCHPDAACARGARYRVEVFGLRTRLCVPCYARMCFVVRRSDRSRPEPVARVTTTPLDPPVDGEPS